MVGLRAAYICNRLVLTVTAYYYNSNFLANFWFCFPCSGKQFMEDVVLMEKYVWII